MKVTIENHRDRLRLRWHDGSKRQSLALGLPESSISRSLAQKKKAEIELDWQTGHYDPTLLKYRPQTLGKGAKEITAPELFARFTKYQAKHKALAQSGVRSRYVPIGKMLEHHLNLPVNAIGRKQAECFADICAQKISDRQLTPATARARIWLLVSCWDWAEGNYQLADRNPWKGLAEQFKASPQQKVKPFTIDELRTILNVFGNHQKHRHYTDFVSFLSNTGCRFGEAAGLRWKHLGADRATAWIGESITRGVCSSTKTGKARTIMLSPVLQTMLAGRFERMNPSAEDLVFPNLQGGAIDDHWFRSRVWKPVLVLCSIEYRRPYTLRHSAISHALAAGANPIALAEQTGHDKRVLLDTYAHVIAQDFLFVEV
jgi:integrase